MSLTSSKFNPKYLAYSSNISLNSYISSNEPIDPSSICTSVNTGISRSREASSKDTPDDSLVDFKALPVSLIKSHPFYL